MEHLNTQTVCTTFNSVQTSYQSGGQFKVEIPQSSVMMVKPLSYEFRVAEYHDENDNVIKVGLQVQVYEHDNYGKPQLRQGWQDVERVRLPLVG